MMPCIACEKASQSKLEPFYRFLRELFCHIFFAPGLITCLNRVWNYCYVYQSDLKSFKCLISGFCFFLVLLASFLHVQLILTSGMQWYSCSTLLSLRKTLWSHLKCEFCRASNYILSIKQHVLANCATDFFSL